MTKKLGLVLLMGTCLLASVSAYAEFGGEYSGMYGKQSGMSHHGESQCPVAGKLMMKAHMLLKHQTDLGLTDEQVKSIKDMKKSILWYVFLFFFSSMMNHTTIIELPNMLIAPVI